MHRDTEPNLGDQRGFLVGKSRNELDKDEGRFRQWEQQLCEKQALENVKEDEYDQSTMKEETGMK